MDINKIASRVSGKCMSHLTVPENGRLAIHFVDGSALLIQSCPEGLAIDFAAGGGTLSRGSAGYAWLKANAASYGFYNLPSEPWHWSTNGN